jgi:hypothetical protein
MVPVVKLWVNMAIDMVCVVASVVPVMPTSRLSWYDYSAQHQTPYEKTKCDVFHFFPSVPYLGADWRPVAAGRHRLGSLAGWDACLVTWLDDGSPKFV